MRIAVFYLVIVFVSHCLYGQEHILSNKTHFELLSIKDGLPSNSANAIVQDKDGFIWIGSFGGLSRYDGYEFKNYQQNKEETSSLVDNYVMEVYVDQSGFIWIGTMTKGLQRFDPRTETFITYPITGLKAIDKYINKITSDTSGNIWVGTMDGLYRVSSPNHTFELQDVTIDHFPAKAYPDTLLHFFLKATDSPTLLASIQKIGKNEYKKQSFSVSQTTTIAINGLGEYGGFQTGMVDYGWISNIAGDTIWQMEYTNTHTAKSFFTRGDHPNNRRAIQLVELEAGAYSLHYRSNDKHHYSQWDLAKIPEPFSRKNGIIPAFDSLWGIQIYTFEKEQIDWIQHQLSQINPNQLVSGSSVNDIYVDKDQLWIASTGGLDLLNINTSTIQHLHPAYNSNTKFQSDHATSIYKGRDGTLWFCGHQLNYQLHKYELVVEKLAPNTNSVSQVVVEPTFNHDAKIIENNNGAIWLAAYFNGLYSLTPTEPSSDSYQLEKYPFSTPNARHLFIDKFNVLWIGVWKEGIYKLNPSAAPFKFVPLPSRGNKSTVTSFVEGDNGVVFVGTSDQGVLKWNQKEGSIQSFSNTQTINQEVVNLAINDNQLWVGINRMGLEVYDLRSNSYIPNFPLDKKQLKNKNFKALLTDPFGTKWISTDGGIFYYLPTDKRVVLHRPLSDILWDGASAIIVNAQQDELVLCDNLNGLHTIDLPSNQLASDTLAIQSNFKNSTFTCISNDYLSDNLWLGSAKGLQLINGTTKELIPLKNQEQIQQLQVSNILPDSLGNLWLSTPNGIGKYTVETGEFRLAGASNGIYLNEHLAGPSISTSWGEILVGGKNGFYHFDPAAIKSNKVLPSVQITKITTLSDPSDSNQATLTLNNPKKLLVLKHYQNTFKINYVGIHFDKSKDKKYAYRMEGLNKNWINVDKERQARFTSLAPGDYTFQVKASNGDGIWNEEGTKIAIQILPPWWKTHWAYLVYILSTISILVAIIRSIFRSQIKRIQLNNQLVYEQKEAERLQELDRLKTNFFSNITHEFRTPLTLIIEPARQLLKKWKGQEDENNIQLIERNSQQLLGLVNQLLDLSKLEGGKMAVTLGRGSLFDAIEPITASFKELAKRKNIEFTIERSEEIPTFYFDKEKIQQILSNLLSNAFKFTDKGSIQLSVTSRKQPSPQLLIKVSDSGIGIADKQVPFIFDRFYQANDTSTNKTTGTGIGLALTKELIELMEGTIEVSSTINEGSTFLVTLPALLAIADSKGLVSEISSTSETLTTLNPVITSPQVIAETGSLNDQLLEKPLVLLVEDNPELRQFLRQSLEKKYTIIEAENGAIGIQLAKKTIPDVIISDVMMPLKDGFEVCDTLKQEELTTHIPIILLTAKSTMDSKLQGLRTGADAYLTKPFHTEELFIRIENLIEIRRKLQAKYKNLNLTTISDIKSLEQHNPAPLQSKKSNKKRTFLDRDFLEKVTKLIQEQLSEETLSVEGVAQQLFISRSQLHRKLKALTGTSPSEFIRNYRLDYSLALLKDKTIKISQVAHEVGFADEKYFSRRFKERFGYPPSEAA